MACAGLFGLIRERFRGNFVVQAAYLGVWTHFSPDLWRRNWRIDQIPHSDEVVSSGRKGEHPSDLVHAAMSGLTQHSDCLQPAEYFLDPFPLYLTYFVSGVSGGAPINGTAAPTFVVLRHMRRDVHAWMRYMLFGKGGKDVGGMMTWAAAGAPAMAPEWMAHIHTAKLDEELKSVVADGGAVIRPAQDIPGIGRFAGVLDPQNAKYLLFEPGRSYAPPRLGQME